MSKQMSSGLAGVECGEQAFCNLFPHRFDFIYANHPELGTSPQWQTESRYPLSDRMISQGNHLYGVRFGRETEYCLIDIDRKSPYHPAADPFAISRIAACLEVIGLVRYFAITSSYSGGLHLYFPFSNAQPSWLIGTAITALLEKHGFLVRSGSLEVFPNRRPYNSQRKLSLFNAHRLPLQSGSYLLNQSFEPIWTDQQRLTEQWDLCREHNQIYTRLLQRIIQQNQYRKHQISGKAEKFLNDLNTEIEAGWTGPGQTNYLLGRITLKLYIFNHLLEGEAPLEGEALVEKVVETARALPGYKDWCNHQYEIEQRASEWARCIENSRYFHYGITKASPEKIDKPNWNQQQQAGARQRIQAAIAQLLKENQFPAQATARFKALLQFGIGGGSLYRHKDLWHPDYLTPPETTNPDPQQTNLLSDSGGNFLSRENFDDSDLAAGLETGGNRADSQDFAEVESQTVSSIGQQFHLWLITTSRLSGLLFSLQQWTGFLPLLLRPP